MITKKVFKDLAIFMIGFGGVIGVVFPFFVIAVTKVPSSTVLTPLFFCMCITAGFLVGLFNIFLAKKIVEAKMKQLSAHMKRVENRLIEKALTQSLEDCSDESCYIKVISEDEIGECARAFNALVKSLSGAFKSEASVRNFTELLSSRLELDQLAEEALSKLMENMRAAGGAIIIEREGELSVLSSYGISTPQAMLEGDMIWQVFKNQKKQILNLPEEIILNSVLLDFRPKSVLLEPILYKGVVLGAVVLAGVSEFTPEMQHNMELFGQGLALAFKNAITHDQFQRLAANDPLTGVLNRRFGLERFRDEYVRAVKTNQPVGVIMIDIDHFKKINDVYGHLIGDRILIMLAQTVKTALREGDVFLRYGGEEFAVILPGASFLDVRQIAERIRRFVEDMEFHQNAQMIKITVSIGGVSFPEISVDDHMKLLEIADAHLYQAKEQGRNRIVVG